MAQAYPGYTEALLVISLYSSSPVHSKQSIFTKHSYKCGNHFDSRPNKASVLDLKGESRCEAPNFLFLFRQCGVTNPVHLKRRTGNQKITCQNSSTKNAQGPVAGGGGGGGGGGIQYLCRQKAGGGPEEKEIFAALCSTCSTSFTCFAFDVCTMYCRFDRLNSIALAAPTTALTISDYR